MLGPAVVSYAQAGQLFAPVGNGADLALTADQEQRAAALQQDKTQTDLRYVIANPAVLQDASVTVPLAAGDVSLGLSQRIDRGPGDFTWIGSAAGDGADSVLVVRNNQITGVIFDGLVEYSITPLGGDLHALTKINQKAFPADHPPGQLPMAPRVSGEKRADVNGTAATTQIDILVAYTPSALAANSNILNTIQLAVDMANASYTRSNGEISLRLVGTIQVTGYSETGKTYNNLLDDLTGGSGVMAPVHSQRNALGADMVSMLVTHSAYCGLAWINSSATSAFSVVTHNCVTNQSFAHELGHNFGALHDTGSSSGTPPFAYGYGYVYGTQWRTIMSYDVCGGCPRLSYFSNPDVSYNGVAMGTATTHNVARVHRERKATVAAFRAAAGGTKAAMTSPAQGSTLGSSATFVWNTGSGVSEYYLYVGTSSGASNIYGASNGTSTSRTVSGLPSSGTIYVRLWSLISGTWQYNDYTYAAGGGTKAVMTSPTPGATLGSSATFVWTTGSGVTQYWLYVGSTGAGSYNIYDASNGTSTTRTVSSLPSSGTIYVRLWSYLTSGGWQYNDYTYTAGGGSKAVMTSPTPGSTLGSSATFVWTTGSGVTQYWLYVGSTGAGSSNIYNASNGTSTTRTVSSLPSSGTIYVRLWSLISGVWQSNDYTYTAGGGTKAVMTSPTPGSTLGASATFVWTTGSGVTQYWLYVGSTGAGSYNIYDASNGTSTTRTVSSLPSSGTIYVRLWSLISGVWQSNDYTYTAGGGTKAVMTSPTPGSTLGSSATFVWTTGSGVTQYWLYVGSTGAGSYNIYDASNGTSTTRTVSGLPSSGTIYVRLWSFIGGSWQSNDYTYSAGGGGKAVMTSPTPGSTLGSSATFVWTTGSGVTQYWLYVGSTGAGSYNIYDASNGTSTTRTVSGLPSSGTIYVRLWSFIGGSWQSNDYTYNAGGSYQATLVSPSDGSTLTNPQAFQWTSVSGASEYWIQFGSTVGGTNYVDESWGTSTSVQLSFTNWASKPLYFRLWTLHSGVWRYNDYQFTGPSSDALVNSDTGAPSVTVAGVRQSSLR